MIVLRVADVEGTWTSVRLVTELWKREPPRPFVRVGADWELALPDLSVDRLEYKLEVQRADGSIEQVCAPGVPTVAQPFGDKSVLVLDGYRAPAWLGADVPRGSGSIDELTIPSARLGSPITGLLWTSPGLAAGTRAPLLIALDGPEYVRFSALDQFLAWAVATDVLPPLRAALLAPRSRDEEYSACDVFADALAFDVIPALEQKAPVSGPGARIALGASLGGLAMLHAHRRMPDLFGALVLQSGSFFDEQLDAQESSFATFGRIAAFVREVASAASAPAPIPVAITCGTGEENIANNRAMAATLGAQGYTVSFHAIRDGHTWVCWRDAFEAAFAAIAPRFR